VNGGKRKEVKPKKHGTMDRKLREDIVAEVQKAMTVAMISLQEQWLTADELCRQFQMFTKDWLEKYGDILPRKRVKVTHMNGETRGTRWAYPRFEIAKNIADGVYNDMKLLR
jgi:hypothetical protein